MVRKYQHKKQTGNKPHCFCDHFFPLELTYLLQMKCFLRFLMYISDFKEFTHTDLCVSVPVPLTRCSATV